MLALGLGLAIGSAGWGALVTKAGLTAGLLAAGATQIIAAFATRRLYAPGTSSAAAVVVTPHWPPPQVARVSAAGPVFVTILYDVLPDAEADFVAIMQLIARTRRATGTLTRDLFRYGVEAGQWLETNLVASWDDHLRQRTQQTAESLH